VNESEENITGFYHILSKDINEVIHIAKSDPRFNDGLWKMEIRPIMSIEGIN
jgi:hypothetical protein